MADAYSLYYLTGYGFFTVNSRASRIRFVIAAAEQNYGVKELWGNGCRIYLVCDLGSPGTVTLSSSSSTIDKVKRDVEQVYKYLTVKVINSETIEVTQTRYDDIANLLNDDDARNCMINGDFYADGVGLFGLDDRIVWTSPQY